MRYSTQQCRPGYRFAHPGYKITKSSSAILRSARRIRRAAPLLHAFRDDLHRRRGRLAHRRVAGDLALDTVTLVAQELAHGAQLLDHVIDLAERGAGDA